MSRSSVPNDRNRCIHFPLCGGCTRLDVPYEEQLQVKQRIIEELFLPLIDGIPAILPSPEQYYYRHKVQLPFGYRKTGKAEQPTVGCYAVDSHRVVNQRMCLIQDRDCSMIIWTLREWAKRAGLSVFNEQSGRGFLRYGLLRKGSGTGEILVGLVTNGGRPEGSRQLARLLLEMLDEVLTKSSSVVGVIQNVNTRKTNVVLGHEEHVWWGRPYLKETMGEWRFKIGLSTFFQVNPFQTPRLYNQVLRHVPRQSRVIDCYCGVGGIALWISRKAGTVVGIEENLPAIRAARTAAAVNNTANVSFTAGDVGTALPHQVRKGYGCAVFDPPRKGLDQGLLPVIAASDLERIIYVSCNPMTLKRDVEQMQPRFRLVSLQGVDMFPHTDHIECVAMLERR